MLSYALVSPIARGLCMLWALMIFLASLYAGVCFVQQRRKAIRFLVLAAPMFADYLLLSIMIDYQLFISANRTPKAFTQAFIKLPVAFAAAILILLTVIAFAQIYSVYSWNKLNVSPMSVKESVDILPSGLCYYYPGGLPKLVNKKMEEQCRSLTGKAPSDMNAFWNALKSGSVTKNINVIQTGENPIFAMPGGEIWSFFQNRLSLNDGEIFEIISADITEEYSVSLELEEKKKTADLINKRLRDLGRDITKMTIEKEVLNTKIRVHDELGSALLFTQRYLQAPDAVNRGEMLEIWKKNVMLLKNERPEQWQEVYTDSFRNAAVLGVDVKISGILPENGEIKDIIDLAVNTCTTNIVRHAKGNTLYITCDGNTVSFKNNGIPPQNEITEGGGLKNLRKVVEKAGGKMRIKALPEFELLIEFKEINDV